MPHKSDWHHLERRLSLSPPMCLPTWTLFPSNCQVSVCSSALSHHNKDLEWRTLNKITWYVTALGSWTDRVTALRSRTDRVIALRPISVTALFYLEDSRKIYLRGMRTCRSKDAKRRALHCARERENLLLTSFCSVFSGFSFPYLLATAILDSFFLF